MDPVNLAYCYGYGKTHDLRSCLGDDYEMGDLLYDFIEKNCRSMRCIKLGFECVVPYPIPSLEDLRQMICSAALELVNLGDGGRHRDFVREGRQPLEEVA